jgi:glycerol-3-phosphate dehydrogenase
MERFDVFVIGGGGTGSEVASARATLSESVKGAFLRLAERP